jgi:hypothetical protein
MANKKQFCIRGHDTHVVGRNRSNQCCSECDRLRKRGDIPPPDAAARLPVEPLKKIMERRGITAHSYGAGLSEQISRFRKWGLAVDLADEWACRLDLHPFDVWGPDWDRACEELDREEA